MTLYKLTNTVTGMSYIGATTRAVNLRMGDHRAQAKRGLPHPLADAIRTYGWSAFAVVILGTFSSLADLHAAERAGIAAANTMVPHGYNRASGGPGTSDALHADETKRKIAERATGRPGHPAWNKGVPHSAETLAKISAGLRGHKAWNKGVPATDEHRAALRASHVGEKHHASRPIVCDGIQYPTIKAAAEGLGLTRMQVRGRLQKGRYEYVTGHCENGAPSTQ